MPLKLIKYFLIDRYKCLIKSETLNGKYDLYPHINSSVFFLLLLFFCFLLLFFLFVFLFFCCCFFCCFFFFGGGGLYFGRQELFLERAL